MESSVCFRERFFENRKLIPDFFCVIQIECIGGPKLTPTDDPQKAGCVCIVMQFLRVLTCSRCQFSV